MQFISHSEEETLILGEIIGKSLKGSEIICLIGDLGSGKTTLVKGIAKGMGIDQRYQVRSPTFTIVNEYPTEKGKLIHVDLYRVGTMDLSEFVERGVVLVEWGENLDICDCFIKIQILDESTRNLILQGRCFQDLKI